MGPSQCHGVGDTDATLQSFLHKSHSLEVLKWEKVKPVPSFALEEAIPHKGEWGWLGGHQLLLLGLGVGRREGGAGARGAGSAVTQPGVAAGEVFVFSF